MKSEHLKSCQVETPHKIVELAWKIARERRMEKKFGKVVDLGAGDARFAKPTDFYKSYVGIEFDQQKTRGLSLPSNARIIEADAMTWGDAGYDLCIGNPPYIRHHNLDAGWRSDVLKDMDERSGIRLKKTANLFVLFLAQALIKTKHDGLVVQVIPFEWVTRPSARELREFIIKKGWSVSVYRFNSDIFPTVLTTASITIIDKSKIDGNWEFGEIGTNGEIRILEQPSGHSTTVLEYGVRKADIFAQRGLSPGGQEIFVLTEEERLHFSLKKRIDVIPCVTTLRGLPAEVSVLDLTNFQRYFIETGSRCWLIRSDKDLISEQLQNYLAAVGNKWEKYSTCTIRKIWYRFVPHAIPNVLFSSGFVGKTPKILVNSVKAIAVGSVYGVFVGRYSVIDIADQLREFDFSERVVSHSNNLKKVEVRQLNTVLAELNN